MSDLSFGSEIELAKANLRPMYRDIKLQEMM